MAVKCCSISPVDRDGRSDLLGAVGLRESELTEVPKENAAMKAIPTQNRKSIFSPEKK